MKKRSLKKNIIIFGSSCLVGFVIFLSVWYRTSSTVEISPPEKKMPIDTVVITNKKDTVATISAVIRVGSENTAISVNLGGTLYDGMVHAREQGSLPFSGKLYPSLGFFVTDIGSLHSGNGKNLLYYVNGKDPSVGVSSYKLQMGDVVEWKLE